MPLQYQIKKYEYHENFVIHWHGICRHILTPETIIRDNRIVIVRWKYLWCNSQVHIMYVYTQMVGCVMCNIVQQAELCRNTSWGFNWDKINCWQSNVLLFIATISLLHSYYNVTSLKAYVRAAFIWKLCCHWLWGLLQHQLAALIYALHCMWQCLDLTMTCILVTRTLYLFYGTSSSQLQALRIIS